MVGTKSKLFTYYKDKNKKRVFYKDKQNSKDKKNYKDHFKNITL